MYPSNSYKLGEFARMIGVHPKTLQRYDKERTLIAFRTDTDRRYYKYYQYLEFINRVKSE